MVLSVDFAGVKGSDGNGDLIFKGAVFVALKTNAFNSEIVEVRDGGIERKARRGMLARPAREPVTDAERATLSSLLAELNAAWAARLGERDFAWRIRRVTSLWGCCHWIKRYVTYSEALARAPRELVEYVVVHELTHFAVHGHGPAFHELMDARLPGWKDLRKRLNGRDWEGRFRTL